MSTRYWSDKKLCVPMRTGDQPEKNFGYRWVLGTGQIKNFGYQVPAKFQFMSTSGQNKRNQIVFVEWACQSGCKHEAYPGILKRKFFPNLMIKQTLFFVKALKFKRSLKVRWLCPCFFDSVAPFLGGGGSSLKINPIFTPNRDAKIVTKYIFRLINNKFSFWKFLKSVRNDL